MSSACAAVQPKGSIEFFSSVSTKGMVILSGVIMSWCYIEFIIIFSLSV